MDNVVALDEGRSGLVSGCPRAVLRLAIIIGLALAGWLTFTLLSSAAHADAITDLTNPATGRTAVDAPLRALDKLVPAKDMDADHPLTAVTATVGDVVRPVGDTVRLVTKSLPVLDVASDRTVAPVRTGHGTHHTTVAASDRPAAKVAALPIHLAPQHPRTESPISLPAPQPASSSLPDLAPSTVPVNAAHSGAGAAAAAIPTQRPEVVAPTGLAQPRPAGSWRVRNAALDPSVSPD